MDLFASSSPWKWWLTILMRARDRQSRDETMVRWISLGRLRSEEGIVERCLNITLWMGLLKERIFASEVGCSQRRRTRILYWTCCCAGKLWDGVIGTWAEAFGREREARCWLTARKRGSRNYWLNTNAGELISQTRFGMVTAWTCEHKLKTPLKPIGRSWSTSLCSPVDTEHVIT